jgi:hypothetical protein
MADNNFNSMTLADHIKANGGHLNEMYAKECKTSETNPNTGETVTRTFICLCSATDKVLPNGQHEGVSVGLSKNLTEKLRNENPEVLTSKSAFMAWCKANRGSLRVTHAEGTKIASMFLEGEGGYDSTFWDD